jgi:hypothetical protein
LLLIHFEKRLGAHSLRRFYFQYVSNPKSGYVSFLSWDACPMINFILRVIILLFASIVYREYN